ncbi:hypothetical protein DYBT9623_02567 [Dyadobacter sp. CECT 9623]|uniref:Uncharacterized protein n=1 Tax=Dyadobacter linearis TaxID=2823330 RepID=A0ABN7RBT5_9BACT|nr:hypothetical protein [Dyadobacter sp. CECT 9623]CAG5069830.1 hypothetical protein DYBT9623_02567 [Dyadobacter sp. CECT 9623]
MNKDGYDLIVSADAKRFYFESVGKRGCFQKQIAFVPIGRTSYNLALLDYDPNISDYSDLPVTDNGDMERVMATVINAIYEFFEMNPVATIYFAGNTPAKTRLYQAVINNCLDMGSKEFVIYGRQDDEWFPFTRSGRYTGFLIRKNA